MMAAAHAVQHDSMFMTALPYGVATSALGIVGAITAVFASSTAAIIMGIALGILGSYGFLAVLTCAMSSRNSDEFSNNIWKHMVTFAGVAVSQLVQFTVQVVIAEGIAAICRRRQ